MTLVATTHCAVPAWLLSICLDKSWHVGTDSFTTFYYCDLNTFQGESFVTTHLAENLEQIWTDIRSFEVFCGVLMPSGLCTAMQQVQDTTRDCELPQPTSQGPPDCGTTTELQSRCEGSSGQLRNSARSLPPHLSTCWSSPAAVPFHSNVFKHAW